MESVGPIRAHDILPRCAPWPRCHVSAAAVHLHSKSDNDFAWAFIGRLRNGTELEPVEPGVPSTNLPLARRAVAHVSAWLSDVKRDDTAAWDEASHGDARRDAIQAVLDTVIMHGRWVNGSWDLLTPLYSDMSWSGTWQILANRSIVFMGDSTMRVLWREFMSLYANTTRWITVNARHCGIEGSGCKHCWMCCDMGCQMGPHSAEHLDCTMRHSQTNLTVDFLWKPEIFDPRDLDAFEERICRHPPDLLVASKGLHDAAFYEFSNESEWRRMYEAGFHRWLPLLRCLQGTQIIWRSPEMPTRQPREAALVILSESVVRRAFRAGEFGANAYLVDALALTNAARATKEKSLVSTDGHHYPPPVLRAEWIMIFLARVLHMR